MRRSKSTRDSTTSSAAALSTASSIDSSSNYQSLNPPPSLPKLCDDDHHHQRNLSMETSSHLPTDLRLGLGISGTDRSCPRQRASADWAPMKTVLVRRAVIFTEEGERNNNPAGSPLSSSSWSWCGQMRQTSNTYNSTSGDNSLFVKVKMEGIKIGRKIDVLALDGYPHLITTLEHMFSTPDILWAEGEQYYSHHKRYSYYKWSHVLTYEDRDGDWMMVGDVPWEMFLTTVKRLKITRTPTPSS